MIHDISAKNFKNFFKWKKIQLQVSKSGVFSEKKIKIPLGRRPFFESKSEAKCPEKPLVNLEKPLANIEKPLANECGRRVHPNYDAPPLTTAGEARGNELPPSLPPSLPRYLPKKFLLFL